MFDSPDATTLDASGPDHPLFSDTLSHIDHRAFAQDLDALHARLKADLGPDDLHHLGKMRRWGRACTWLGYACAWIVPNPLAALLMGMGNVARWTCIAHPILHRGYDAVPDVPAASTSRRFAQGWRRMFDWPDWLLPAAWSHEHNRLHHYHTGQEGDPDLVERNAKLIRDPRIPRVLKWTMVVFMMATWKLIYYAPNTYWTLRQRARVPSAAVGANPSALAKSTAAEAHHDTIFGYPGERLLLPVTRGGVAFHLRCVLPYGLLRFGVIPALFLPLGTAAWAAVLINSVLAEIVANVVSFVIIAPNHTGDDVHRFDHRPRSKAEFYVQQVAGSVNYPGGSDLKDFLQGYLNYQIEHHLWPDLPLLKYRQAAPQVKAICARHGVPYIEESVFKRFARLWSIMMGDRSMRRADTRRA